MTYLRLQPETNILHELYHFMLITIQGSRFHYVHLTQEQTIAWGTYVTCPGVFSQEMVEPGQSNSWSCDPFNSQTSAID